MNQIRIHDVMGPQGDESVSRLCETLPGPLISFDVDCGTGGLGVGVVMKPAPCAPSSK